jgi:T-complex protein 1 subunit zeta
MQIQHPTASLIARTATAQDDITGDGTTSVVLFVGELLRWAEHYVTSEKLHPRVLAQGIEIARDKALSYLDKYKTEYKGEISRDILMQVARSSLHTKLYEELADHIATIVVDAVLTIKKDNQPVDLHMIEIMHMKHQSPLDSKFVDGIVLDHGTRHPDMPKRIENAFIFVCNVSLEYEKTMVNSSFFYKDATERQKMVAAERKFTNDKVEQIIAFKNEVCTDGQGFVIVNQKGIDPISLDMLQKAGISGIRRAKRRNMERIPRACGGYAVNALDELKADCLGFAKLVYEHTLGEDKYTFIEGCGKEATSCTILIKGPHEHVIRQVMDAVRDGLRAVSNVMEDKSVVPGAGAFEAAAAVQLRNDSKVSIEDKAGVLAYANALEIIPRTLAQNSGFEAYNVIESLRAEAAEKRVGVDVETGKLMLPEKNGVLDNFCVKKQFLSLGTMIAVKLLLVDEVLSAGRKMGGKPSE